MNINFTTHSIERFKERFPENAGRNPVKTLHKLFKQAKQIYLNPTVAAIRIMNNNFEQTDYYVVDGIRFVVVKGVVVTIEKNN